MRHRLRLTYHPDRRDGFFRGRSQPASVRDGQPLEVLPKNLPSVEALKVSQKHFDNDQQVVLLLESRTEEIHEDDAAELAALLREKLAPAKVLYKSELRKTRSPLPAPSRKSGATPRPRTSDT